MKELNNTRRLTISTILFVIALIIGFITFRKPAFTYKMPAQEMVDQLNNQNNQITPPVALQIMSKNDPSNIFVDLRDPYVYQKGYLGEAVNIPVSDILQQESIDFFDDMLANSISVILYANNQFEANGAWMLLQQLGYSNVKILLGGYNYFIQYKADDPNLADSPEYLVEEPAFSFSEMIENMGSKDSQPTESNDKPQNIQPVKRKKKAAAQGGC